MRHPLRSSLGLLWLALAGCEVDATFPSDSDGTKDGLDAKSSEATASMEIDGDEPKSGSNCGEGNVPQPDSMEDCFGQVFEACADASLDAGKCKDLALQKCEPPAPPNAEDDCFGQVFEACADGSLDDGDCKEIAVHKCEPPPAPSTAEDDCFNQVFEACNQADPANGECKQLAYDKCFGYAEPSEPPADDCYGTVQDYCEQQKVEPETCKDLMIQKCEPNTEPPTPSEDPFTACLEAGKDPAGCKEATAGDTQKI